MMETVSIVYNFEDAYIVIWNVHKMMSLQFEYYFFKFNCFVMKLQRKMYQLS